MKMVTGYVFLIFPQSVMKLGGWQQFAGKKRGLSPFCSV
jgi:hypothetical protein